jgi:hypothetical protein
MNWETHPLQVIREIMTQYGDHILFEFSRYRYTPLALDEERSLFQIPAVKMSERTLEDALTELNRDEDLSIHSRVFLENGLYRHIPMIDFRGSITKEKCETMIGVLGKDEYSPIWLYDSGKSYHGYICCLIDENQWRRFMGTLLLLNLPNKEEIVDWRWVGHRLRAGYGALRWSCNANSYSIVPRNVGVIELSGRIVESNDCIKTK